MTSPRASEEPGAEEPTGADARDSSAVTPESTPGEDAPTPTAGTPASPGTPARDQRRVPDVQRQERDFSDNTAAAPPTAAEPDEPPGTDEAEHPSPRPTGIRWAPTGEAPAQPRPADDDDPTPPSGIPAGQTTPGTWPHPGSPRAAPPAWPTAPGWAPPATRPRDPARRRRIRRIVLAIVLGVLVVAAVVVALLAFLVGPRFARYDVLDRASVERGVTDVVTRDWHRNITGVTCPDRQRVSPGTSFVCTATVDGRPQQVPVDVTDENGSYAVGQPR